MILTSTARFFIYIFLILGATSVMSEEGDTVNQIHKHRHVRRAETIVGGYSPANPRDPSVIEAAEVVVTKLKQGQGPIDKYSFDFPVGSGTSGNFEIKILGASQQVSMHESCHITICSENIFQETLTRLGSFVFSFHFH